MSGKVVSVYSSRGGVGKSFVAVNLAVSLHLETREKVLLVDFARPYSIDIAAILDLEKVNSLESILPNAARLNPAVLKTFVTSHPSGVDVLALGAGKTPVSLKGADAANLRAALGKFMLGYGYIVVDCGTVFDEATATVLDISSLALLLAAPDFLSVQHAYGDVALLRNQNFPQEMVKLVCNFAGRESDIDAQKIEQVVNKQLFGEIPFDPQGSKNFQGGKTYPRDFPRHEVTKGFDSLTGSVVRAAAQSAPMAVELEAASREASTRTPEASELDQLKMGIHQKLLETMDLKHADLRVENDPEKKAELEREVTEQILAILDAECEIRSRELRANIVREVLQDVLGLGVLEDILADGEVSEIMINRFDEIYVERKGRIELCDRKFFSERHLMRVIDRIVAPLGRKIDTSTPMVDARLKDGSRVNAIIPPLAINGACMTIRKFPTHRLGMDDLLRFGALSKQMAQFLDAAVKSRLNVLISGGTGSGKTTLLNILSGFIPSDERIITVEDSAELKLQQPHVITLEARPPNIEGTGEVSIRDLVKNTLRMRPDRIVVGECRSAEALDMLQAMNTGHDGSLTTIHANSAREAVGRLETLVMFAGFDLSAKAIREQIVGAIDLIVQVKRFKDGSRHIIQVSEITGMEGEVVTMGDVFEFKESGLSPEGKVQGAYVSTGYIPRCLETFEDRGISVPREIFWNTN